MGERCTGRRRGTGGRLAYAALRLRAALRERGVRREKIGEQKEKSKLAEVANIIMETAFSVLLSPFYCLLSREARP